MSHRYFSPTPIDFHPDRPASVTLADAEAHHLLHVMRARPGDRVTLFDGAGAEFAAEVVATSRREAELAVLSRDDVDREAPVAVTLGVAMPKGDRQKVLVEKLTELGAARLVPLLTERSVAAPKASGLEKLRRLVIEASKQCGRNRLMRIDEPVPLHEFLANAEAGARYIAHPPSPEAEAVADSIASSLATAAVAIGPEGGFTDEEVAMAEQAGWRRLALARSVLRIETAAIAAAARLTHRG